MARRSPSPPSITTATRLWERDLGPFRSEHGSGASPVVFDGRVYVNFDQDRVNSKTGEEIPGAEHGTAMLAFDAATGKPLWRAERRRLPRLLFGADPSHRPPTAAKKSSPST